jgi:hypothetical protein
MKEHTDNSDLMVSDRRQFVLDFYLKGFKPNEIFKQWNVQYPGLTKHSFDKDVTAVYVELKERGERDIDVIITRHLNYLEDVYKECRDKGDASNAIKALKEVRETLGIGGTKVKTAVQINQTVNHNTMPKLSIDEIKSLLGRNAPVEVSNTVIDITPTE